MFAENCPCLVQFEWCHQLPDIYIVVVSISVTNFTGQSSWRRSQLMWKQSLKWNTYCHWRTPWFQGHGRNKRTLCQCMYWGSGPWVVSCWRHCFDPFGGLLWKKYQAIVSQTFDIQHFQLEITSVIEVKEWTLFDFEMDYTKQWVHFRQILPSTKRRTDKQIKCGKHLS